VKLLAESSDTGITFHKYGTIEEHEDGAIDFVFATKGTKALTYKIIRDSFDGIYPSDHYPVVADILL
jgi:endonuclease/exonuclease/phosphatase family metal-dependent hydrolase